MTLLERLLIRKNTYILNKKIYIVQKVNIKKYKLYLIKNITTSGIKWNLKKMKDNGIIGREGTARKGRWVIK